MPKDPLKHRLNGDITIPEYKKFFKEARKREWSDKKLTEQIIKWWLQSEEKPLLKKG